VLSILCSSIVWFRNVIKTNVIMSYQLYRNTTLGHTLQESLDELIQVRSKCVVNRT
jgi:hypothetical protein